MKLQEMRPLTQDIIQIKDAAALALTKKTLGVLSKTFNIPVARFPKPSGDIIRDMSPLYEMRTEYPNMACQNFLFAIAMIGSQQAYFYPVSIEEAISYFAYLLAINSLTVTSIDINLNKTHERFSDMQIRGVAALNFYAMVDYINSFKINVTSEAAVKTPTPLPRDLANHLSQFDIAEEVAVEVCKLLMLGPDTWRAEDAQKALINVWKITQYGK